MTVEISPTFRSGAYFAPMAMPKVLEPRRPQREHWGFHAKTYGGVGELFFDSQFKVGRKGLLVSRGHDHTGGGIEKFHPVKQPYQVTSLSKSACRPSDQLVPDVTKVDLISIAKDANLLTSKHYDQNYAQPIFEVFPTFEVKPHKQNMEALSTKQNILGAKNVAALEDLTKQIYNVTSHRREYDKDQSTPSKVKPKKTVRIITPNPLPGREYMYNEVMSQPSDGNPKCALCNCQINITDFYDSTTNLPVCNYCKSTGIFRMDFYENPSGHSEETKPTITTLSLSELRRFTGSMVRKADTSTRTPDSTKEPTLMKLIKAPIETTHLYTSPLNYLGYYNGRNRNRLSSLIRKLPNSATVSEDTEDIATPHEAQSPKRLSYERVAVPVSIKDKEYLREKGICSSGVFLSTDNPRSTANLSEVYPNIHFPLSWENEKTLSSKDDQETPDNMTKKSSPQKIKEFKSLAHKRFHQDFPESIPDLRVSRKDSKKYFFHGYHASVFRG